MDAAWKKILWQQFGAALDALEACMQSCPESLWGDRSRKPEFWYTAYHALFWLDHDFERVPDRYVPPEPFGLEEMDPAGVLPPRVYTQAELLGYLAHGRARAHVAIRNLGDDALDSASWASRVGLCEAEMLLYTLRHLQHHVGQLNMILSQVTGSAPRWAKQAKQPW